MSNMGPPSKTGPPQIVKLNKALKLAEEWVNNMTKIAEDKQVEEETVSRPARLGLGAKVSRQPIRGQLKDPLDRKLHSKLEAGKRKFAKKAEEETNKYGDEDENDEIIESRTTIFDKKNRAAVPGNAYLQLKKKQSKLSLQS